MKIIQLSPENKKEMESDCLENILYTTINLTDWEMICSFKNQKISHLSLFLSPSNHENCSICLCED